MNESKNAHSIKTNKNTAKPNERDGKEQKNKQQPSCVVDIAPL